MNKGRLWRSGLLLYLQSVQTIQPNCIIFMARPLQAVPACSSGMALVALSRKGGLVISEEIV